MQGGQLGGMKKMRLIWIRIEMVEMEDNKIALL